MTKLCIFSYYISVFLLSILLKEKDREKDRPGIKDHIRKIYEANVHLSEMITLAADHIQSSLKNQIKESVNTRHLLKQIISSITHLNYGQFIFEGDFPVLFTNKLKLQRIFELLLLSLAENNNEDEEIIIGVTGKTLFYEFYISYNSRLQVPDFKKIFIFPKDSVPTKKQPSKIGLNVIKMLVEEQCGKLELVKKTGEKNTVSFEWMK